MDFCILQNSSNMQGNQTSALAAPQSGGPSLPTSAQQETGFAQDVIQHGHISSHH